MTNILLALIAGMLTVNYIEKYISKDNPFVIGAAFILVSMIGGSVCYFVAYLVTQLLGL